MVPSICLTSHWLKISQRKPAPDNIKLQQRGGQHPIMTFRPPQSWTSTPPSGCRAPSLVYMARLRLPPGYLELLEAHKQASLPPSPAMPSTSLSASASLGPGGRPASCCPATLPCRPTDILRTKDPEPPHSRPPLWRGCRPTPPPSTPCTGRALSWDSYSDTSNAGQCYKHIRHNEGGWLGKVSAVSVLAVPPELR